MNIVNDACEYLSGNMTIEEVVEYITKKIEQEALEEAMKIYCPRYEVIKMIIDEEFEPHKTEMYNNIWDNYKNRLPLWSDINSNCYFKLKEN